MLRIALKIGASAPSVRRPRTGTTCVRAVWRRNRCGAAAWAPGLQQRAVARRRNEPARASPYAGGTMATKQSSGRRYGKTASKRVASAMRRRKSGTLKRGKAGHGGRVTSREQAIAIGLSEAREKGAKVPRKRTSKKSSSKKSTRKKSSSKKSSSKKSTRKKSTRKKSSR